MMAVMKVARRGGSSETLLVELKVAQLVDLKGVLMAEKMVAMMAERKVALTDFLKVEMKVALMAVAMAALDYC